MSEALQTERERIAPPEKGLPLFVAMCRSLFSFRKPRSLRANLAQWNALVLLLTLALLESVVYQMVTAGLISDLDSHLTAQATRLQAATARWKASGTPADLNFLKQLVHGDRINEFTANSIYIKLFDVHSGQLLTLSPQLEQISIPLSRSDFTAALQGRRVLSVVGDRDGDQAHTLTFPLYDKSRLMIAIAQVSQSLQVIRQVQPVLLLVLGIVGLLAALASYAFSFYLMSQELRPLSRLIVTMHRLSAQHFDIRFHPARLTVEIIMLTQAFNQMLDRLQASFALQRSFVSNVSHELRTPLTAIQGQIDVMLLNPELKGEMREDLQGVSAELRRLTRLVTNLLTSARAEAGMFPRPFDNGGQIVDLDALLVEVAHQARFINQQIRLEVEHLEQVGVPGEADLLKQLLLNLVENALTYTPAGGEVKLAVIRCDSVPAEVVTETAVRSKEWARLSVCDSGPGIDPEDLPHIFERNYRGSYGREVRPSGSGLGLFIARLIAHVHHGAITINSEMGKGTCFHVWLPAAVEGAAFRSS
ncbi:MAG TPA: HAMP domain-containing sensor histidine kinase [Ktedonobacteraceae bacterium]|nr:HAMP domain-containing sensor histidine kinase [Ktedonobacteraceae bacterium]